MDAPLQHQRITVDADLFRLAMKFQAKGDIRYYLNGVLVEKHPEKGVYLVATNGHALGVFYDASAEYEAAAPYVIVDLAPAAAMHCKAKRPNPLPRKVSVEIADPDKVRGAARIVDKNGAEFFIQPGNCLIDGKFPDWRRVVPPFEKMVRGLPARINHTYLRQVFDVAAAKENRDFCGIASFVESGKEDSGVAVFHWETVPNGCALVMPMAERSETDPAKLFSFLGQPEKKAA